MAETDLISRQAAIDALRYAQHRFTVADEAGGMGTVKWSEDVIYFAAAERVLTELPSAQPEQQWIPVTEGLPKVKGCYLVSVKNEHERIYSKTAWFEKGSWFARQDVTAWMPLPEPYGAEGSDKE